MRKQARPLRLARETLLRLAVGGDGLNQDGSSGCGPTRCCTTTVVMAWCSSGCETYLCEESTATV